MISLFAIILANVGSPIDLPETPKGPNGPGVINALIMG